MTEQQQTEQKEYIQQISIDDVSDYQETQESYSIDQQNEINDNNIIQKATIILQQQQQKEWLTSAQLQQQHNNGSCILTEEDFKAQMSIFGNYSTERLKKIYDTCKQQYKYVSMQTFYKYLKRSKFLTNDQIKTIHDNIDTTDNKEITFGCFCQKLRSIQ